MFGGSYGMPGSNRTSSPAGSTVSRSTFTNNWAGVDDNGNGSTYVVYNTDIAHGGKLMITEVGNDFSKRDHLGVFHTPLAGAPDNGRSAAPSFGTYQGREYMIYEAGERLAGNIAIARAV